MPFHLSPIAGGLRIYCVRGKSGDSNAGGRNHATDSPNVSLDVTLENIVAANLAMFVVLCSYELGDVISVFFFFFGFSSNARLMNFCGQLIWYN